MLNTDFAKGYHTYAVDWTPDYIAWYIDGVEQYRVTDKSILPSKRMYLIANLQVGGSWAGSPNASTVFPANYDIDYIRVWKRVTPSSSSRRRWPPTCCQTAPSRPAPRPGPSTSRPAPPPPPRRT